MIRTDATLYDPERPFTLSSGLKSNILFKLDRVLANSYAANTIADFFLKATRENNIEFAGVGGLETGSIVIANSIALRAAQQLDNKTIFWVRKRMKHYGDNSGYDGIITPGSKVFIVDDVGTTGGAIVKAAKCAQAAGAIVTGAGVVVERGMGAKDTCDILGIPYIYMYRGRDVLSGMNIVPNVTPLWQ